MDLKAIEDKLNALSSNDNQDKVDYSKLFWKPEFGTQTIRIVPSKVNPEFPFTEMKFHYGVGKFPMASLSNWGKQDPIEEFIKELKKSDEKENWQLAGKLTPKTRIFAPVVVRGEEDKGVRLWGFGVKVYKALLALAQDEDIGDYTDVNEGWDIKISYEKGSSYPTTSINIKPKQVPLSKDAKEVENFLKEQPVPLESFTQFEYDYIKKQLQSYLSPSDDEETDTPSVEATEDSAGDGIKPNTDFSLEKKEPNKKSNVEKFNELFND